MVPISSRIYSGIDFSFDKDLMILDLGASGGKYLLFKGEMKASFRHETLPSIMLFSIRHRHQTNVLVRYVYNILQILENWIYGVTASNPLLCIISKVQKSQVSVKSRLIPNQH